MMLITRSAIRLDGGTQPRATINSPLFEEYAHAIADGATLPPVVVFLDGTDYWLADGFHRYYAHETLALAEIEADVRQGDRRDAVLHSVGANADHGWRRSNDDKRRAVLALLNDTEWSAWSDNAIARRCRVSHTFVGKLRPAPINCNVSSEEPRTFRDRHGNEGTMNVAAIGRAPRPSSVGYGQGPVEARFSSRITMADHNQPFSTVGTEGCAGGVQAVDQGRATVERLHQKPPPRDPVPYDHDANRPFLAAVEMLEAIVTGVSPVELLRWWETYTGAGFASDVVAAARAWIVDFEDGYPAAERSRQSLLARITEEACQ